MTTSYDYAASPIDRVRTAGSVSTEHATAIVVAAALIALVAIRRGFRGVNVAGVGVSIH